MRITKYFDCVKIFHSLSSYEFVEATLHFVGFLHVYFLLLISDTTHSSHTRDPPIQGQPRSRRLQSHETEGSPTHTMHRADVTPPPPDDDDGDDDDTHVKTLISPSANIDNVELEEIQVDRAQTVHGAPAAASYAAPVSITYDMPQKDLEQLLQRAEQLQLENTEKAITAHTQFAKRPNNSETQDTSTVNRDVRRKTQDRDVLPKFRRHGDGVLSSDSESDSDSDWLSIGAVGNADETAVKTFDCLNIPKKYREKREKCRDQRQHVTEDDLVIRKYIPPDPDRKRKTKKSKHKLLKE